MKHLKHYLILWLISLTIISCSQPEETLRQGAYFTEEEGAEALQQTEETITSKEDWEAYTEVIRQGILKGAELDPLPAKTPLKVIRKDLRTYDRYTVENIAFESLPGVFVTGALYAPVNAEDEIPGILSPHGHWPDPDDYGRFRPDVQKRAASLAKMGSYVFTYDMVGYGEMRDYGWEEHRFPTTLKFQLWNSIRAVDFMLTLDNIDSERLGVTGASGGGTQTFLLAAVDDRMDVSVPTVMVSAHFFGGCTGESGMPIHESATHQTNNVEIASSFAPKPQLIISDGDDWTKNNPDVEYPFMQYIYGLYDQTENVENVHLPDDVHDYGINKRLAMYPFMAKHLALDIDQIMDGDQISEEGVVIEEYDTFMIFDDQTPFPDYGIRSPEEVMW